MKNGSVIAGADVVTFDIWDTVLRRTCHPEALKRYAAGQLIEKLGLAGVSVSEVHAYRLALEAQLAKTNEAGEFTLSAVITAQVAHYAQGLSTATCAEIVHALVEAELAAERRVTYADPTAVALIRTLQKKAWFISDYYCPSAHIWHLLQDAGLADSFAGGIVSCERGESKRQGGLYATAKTEFRLEGQWVHIGDHPYSDVTQSQKFGAKAIAWVSAESRWLADKARQLRLRQQEELEWGGPAFAVDMSAGVYGQYLAPLVAGYCNYVEDIAHQVQARRVVFLAREGLFFARAFKLLATRDVVTLDVSRRATFAGSIADNPAEGLVRMWRQYAAQSPEALCTTLNAPPEVFRPLFERAGFPWTGVIADIARHKGLQQLMGSPAFQQAFKAHLATERDSVKSYVAQVLGELPQPGATYVVADVGWKGTIQDNLARLFPESIWLGVYCGLAPRPEDGHNSPKRGYVADSSRQKDWQSFLKESLPFEMLFNAAQGSTLGYVKNDQGCSCPVYDELAGESAVHRNFTEAVQEGCLAALPLLHYAINRQAVSHVELTELARRLWLGVLQSPPACLLDAGYALEHNESFGVGASVTFRRDFSWKDLLRALTNRQARQAVSGWIARMPWRRVVMLRRDTSLATKFALLAFHFRERLR